MSIRLLTRYGLPRDITSPPPGPGGAPDGNTHYVEVTLPIASATLTSFPVYVNMADLPAAFWSRVQSDGRDIRVTDAANNLTPRDLALMDDGESTGELHFLANLSASAATVYRIWYGNASATQPTTTDTYGRNAVWAAYDLVTHNGGNADAAGNNTFSSGGSGTPTTVTGKVGQALRYSDSTMHRRASSVDLADTGITASFWLALTNTTQTQRYVSTLIKTTTPAAGVLDVIFGFTTRLLEGYGDTADDLSRQTIHDYTAGDTAWHHVAITNDGDTSRYYFDGAEVTNVVDVVLPSRITEYRLGGTGTANRTTACDLDEYRVMNAAEAPARIEEQYANQNAPASWYSVGDEVTA